MAALRLRGHARTAAALRLVRCEATTSPESRPRFVVLTGSGFPYAVGFVGAEGPWNPTAP
ncbi:MAG TPA: hypothetical protein VMG99_03925 [Thermoplasmata archaeon]|nr:hypothetical protein [Thermoplasmata archaeon]